MNFLKKQNVQRGLLLQPRAKNIIQFSCTPSHVPRLSLQSSSLEFRPIDSPSGRGPYRRRAESAQTLQAAGGMNTSTVQGLPM